MFLYTPLMASYDSNSTTHYKTTLPTGWMERQGDTMFSTLITTGMSPNCKITLKVYLKNKDDAGNGDAAAGGSISLSDDNNSTIGTSSLKELVRYELICEVDDTLEESSVFGSARVLAPQWEWTGA